MFILLSIIITVYNDENNISRCINSVLSQIYPDFECLIIDDGSTDKTSSICDEYSKNDKRIRVFHKENEGISKTRQYGINRANGEYIYFIDSDDWIDSSFTADILEEINKDKPDLLFFDYFKNYSKNKSIYKSQKPFSKDNDIIVEFILEKKILSCPWNFVISKLFIINNKVFFNKKINYGEDTLFIIELLFNNPIIIYINKAYYHHFINDSSYTRTNLRQKYIDRILFYNCLSELFQKYKKEEILKYNFFPMNDKFEMLSSGIFTRNEYQNIFSVSLSFFYARNSSFIKFFLLYLAETPLYYLAKCLAVFIKYLRHFA
jgi:glycosyltransferase involved in cell wall biosynthesis